MRVVILSDVFAPAMGYSENMLPKYLARLGADVHVVTMDLPLYYWSPESMRSYGEFATALRAGSVTKTHGYTLHVLGHRKIAGYMKMVGLYSKLHAIRPNIVQTSAPVGWPALETFLYKPIFGYQIFSGCHMTASAFPLTKLTGYQRTVELCRCLALRYVPGALISSATKKCYAVTEDCAEIAARYFGVPHGKIQTMYLGVDTEYFYRVQSEAMERERSAVRAKLGFESSDVVCIYSGKFIPEKKLQVFAEAVERLRRNGLPFRALFIGDGPDRAILKQYSSAVSIGFMHFSLLGKYYRAADIGVWPGTESTSMLDAAACGIPVIISDAVLYRAPVNGNGYVFQRDNVDDLARVLSALADRNVRIRLGRAGAERMAAEFSWKTISTRRLRDYESALETKSETHSAVATVFDSSATSD